jgi:hypothetical protein
MIKYYFFAVPFLFACSSDPYPLGFQFTTNIEETQTTTSFRIVDGGEVEESLGVLGGLITDVCPEGECQNYCEAYGCETQSIAASSSGSRFVSSHTQNQILSVVVGETYLSHPLVPNEDEFDKIPASVLQERSRSASYSITDETIFDPLLDTPQYSLLSYTDDAVVTNSGYYGVAADEYVVRFDLGTLWSDFDEEVDTNDVELLTRNDPQEGDVWVSENGNTLYIYAGESALNFAGQAVKVDKVEMFEAINLQPEGADVFSQCLNFGKLQKDSTDSETIFDSSVDTVLLDSGCQGDFTHLKVGTQLWYDNVLVSEESSSQEISISSYGYEWYEEQAPNVWVRKTAYDNTEPSAVPFIEYTLTESVETLTVDKWVEP